MADDWATASDAPSGYLSGDDFRASMDSIYGAGNWRETGGWRSQGREQQLRASGAATVPAGSTSWHSLGTEDAPGAHDIVVNGMTPQQAAAKLRASQLPIGNTYPEGAAGGQGAHLHVGMSPGLKADPWAAAQPENDPWATAPSTETPPGKPGLLASASRLVGSLVGGAEEGAAQIIRGGGRLADLYAQQQAKVMGQTGVLGNDGLPIPLDQQEQAQAAAVAKNRTPTVSPAVDPWATALEDVAAKTEPAQRSGLESVAHGAGGFVPMLGAAAVNPALGIAAFGAGGYQQGYDEAKKAGASEEVAQKAGLESAGLQAGIGAIPFGKMAEPLVGRIGGRIAGALARTGAEAAGGGVAGAGIQAGENVIAQQNYDPDRPLLKGVPEAALEMAAGAGAIHGVSEAGGAVVNRLRPREQPVTPQAEEATASAQQAMPESVAAQAYRDITAARKSAIEAPPETVAQPSDIQQEIPAPAPAGGDIDPAGNAAAIPTRPPTNYETARISEGASPEQMPQAIADIAELRQSAPKSYTVFQAMKDLGGIRAKDAEGSVDGDVQQALGGARMPGLINNKTGLTPDAMREALQERGWFGTFDQRQGAEEIGPKPGDNVQDLLDLMDRHVRDGPVRHPDAESQDQLARRATLESEMLQAGVGIKDEPPVAAAKLAAWRETESKQNGPEMEALRARAAAAEVPHVPGMTYDELLGDVVEREAIQHDYDGAAADHDEHLIDAELTPEEHEWLAAAGRGAEGEQGPAGELARAAGGEAREPGAQEGSGELGADAGGGGARPYEVSGLPELVAVDPNAIVAAWEKGWGPFRDRHGEVEDAMAHGRQVVVPRETFEREIGGQPFEAHVRQNSEFEGASDPWAVAGETETHDIGHETVDQGLLGGMQRSAQQAAQARGEVLRAKAPQQEPGGLFAPPEPEQAEFKLQRASNFYSPAERAVAASDLKSASADQWLREIRKARGVQTDELRWLGLREWMRGFGDAQISKSALQAFLRDQVAGANEVAAPRAAGIRPAPKTPDHVLDEIAKRYEGGQSYRKIMGDLRVSSSTINRVIGTRNLLRRPKIGETGYSHPDRIEEAIRDEALRLYAEVGLSAEDTARRLGISQAAVSRMMVDAGVTRTPSERMAKRAIEGPTAANHIAAPWQSAKDGSWQFARSTYEMARMHQLDRDPDVASYTKKVEAIPLPDGRRYMPDIEVQYRDGRREVEEVKPEWAHQAPDVLAKEVAARAYLEQQGITYRIVGAQDIGPEVFRDLRDHQLGGLSEDERARAKKSINTTIARPEKPLTKPPLFQSGNVPGNVPGTFKSITRGLQGREITPEQASDLVDRVAATLARIAPHVEAKPYAALRTDAGKQAFGATFRQDAGHVIAWALEGPDALQTVRHEALHALRAADLFKAAEWSALSSEALRGDWLNRFSIPERYPDLSPEQQVEEAVAEAYGDWRKDIAVRDLPSFAKALFQRIKDALGHVASTVRQVLGGDIRAEDVFRAIESGRVGAREPGQPGAETGAPAVRYAVPPDDAKAEKVRGFVNKALGDGMDAIGEKISRTAAQVLPDPLIEFGHAIRMGLNPMAAGSERAQATAKDFANAWREHAWEWSRVDRWLEKTFTSEQRRAMWEAADEESVIRQKGAEPGPVEGLNRLAPEERAAVEELQKRANTAFNSAKDLGMTTAEGLPSYVPRMVVDMTAEGAKRVKPSGEQGSGAAGIGRNLKTTSTQLKHRKYLETAETEAAAQEAFGAGATVVRDIRTLAMATGKLEQAVAGRRLVDHIKEAGAAVGENLVSDGASADPKETFTLDHPALRTWRPKLSKDPATGKWSTIDDPATGRPVMEAQPLYIAKEFEGPLKAVLTQSPGQVEKALMTLKGKAMSVIMYSPLMHNAVIWGKAIPAAPKAVLGFTVYRKGYLAKTDPSIMREAIRAGLDPIGKKFFNQDITAIASPPQIEPGHSWTAKLLGAAAALPARAAGKAVAVVRPDLGADMAERGNALSRATKEGIDRLGDLWHNTFLWDRVGDLQMGIYTILRDSFVKHGLDPQTAQRVAAHYANRYAGALPMEAMSKLARNVANVALFSRSFTMTNLGAWKDSIAGLPTDVQAQIMRDKGFQELKQAQGTARGKAMAMIVMDVALAHVGLLLAAGAVWGVHHMLGDKSFAFQAPGDNEKGKENRVLMGYQPDGTAIYGRLPTGKVAEDLLSWITEPVSTGEKKLSPYGKVALEVASNDKGFGRKLYDPYDKTPTGFLRNTGRVVLGADLANLHSPDDFTGGILGSFTPVGLLQGLAHLGNKSEDQRTAALEATLPLFGITVSKGAPGGPAMGDLFRAQDEHDFQVAEKLPGIRKDIKAGKVQEARVAMSRLGIAPGLQSYYVRTTLNPAQRLTGRKLHDFLQYASPEDRKTFEEDQAQALARRQAVAP